MAAGTPPSLGVRVVGHPPVRAGGVEGVETPRVTRPEDVVQERCDDVGEVVA